MRFVLCDDDEMFRSLVESICERLGHEVIGVADTTVDATGLIEAAKPDVLVVDPSIGINTDFDVIEVAVRHGTRVVVFSYQVDSDALASYDPRPHFIPKPDFSGLEHELANLRLGVAEPDTPVSADRRHRPARAAAGPHPTGLTDAQSFYESLNSALGGDAIVQVDGADGHLDGLAIAEDVQVLVRATDRVLASPTSVKIYLAGAELEGAQSLVRRLSERIQLPAGARVRSVVLSPDEGPSAAFDRLRDLP